MVSVEQRIKELRDQKRRKRNLYRANTELPDHGQTRREAYDHLVAMLIAQEATLGRVPQADKQ